MRIFQSFGLFLLFAVVYFGGTVCAQEPAWAGRIEGSVRVKTGSSAALEVTAIEVITGRPHFTKTDEKGRFRFSGLSPGDFQVFAASSRFFPVWEAGTVDENVVWQPELFLEVPLFRSLPVVSRRQLPPLESFRNASAICLGTIEFVKPLPKDPENKQLEAVQLTVFNRTIFKGKQVPARMTVEHSWNQGTDFIRQGQWVLVWFDSGMDPAEPRSAQLLFPPKTENGASRGNRFWQLVEMSRSGRLSRTDLTEWLVDGIQDKTTRRMTTTEILGILQRSQIDPDSKASGPTDPYDLADPERPLFSEAQVKRITDALFQDDSMATEDFNVVGFLIQLKNCRIEELLLDQIKQRAIGWTALTEKLLNFHASCRKEKESVQLARLYEDIQTAAFYRVANENLGQIQMTDNEQVSKVRRLVEPQLLLILKSYLWSVEHPAKDAQ